MTSPTGIRTRNNRAGGLAGGFTLIELMLVMAMLLVVMGISFPSLRGFFKGRNLDSEARRLLAMTHYGQSRAVSDGIPMELWIDPEQRSYGLRAATGYTDPDPRPLRNDLADKLEIQVSAPAPQIRTVPTRQYSSMAKIGPAIRFLPDGTIGESSPQQVTIQQVGGDGVKLVQSANRLKYEIQPLPANR